MSVLCVQLIAAGQIGQRVSLGMLPHALFSVGARPTRNGTIGDMELKRCERELEPAMAAGVQAIVRKLCGRCLCETGDQCPLFSYKKEEASTPRAV